MNQLEKEVYDLVESIGGRVKNGSLSSRLYHDFSLSGDDAWEFLEAFASKYNVEMKKFNFETFFVTEGDAMWLWMIEIFGWRDKKVVPVTVSHLVSVAEKGSWFDPD